MSLREVIQQVKPCVCQIKSHTNQGTYRGSGFLVGDSMKIVTCYHVINPAGSSVSKVEVVFGGQPYEILASGIKSIPSADIAVLDASGTNAPNVKGLTLGRFSDAEEGDDIVVVGFPLGEEIITTHKGIISSKGRFQFIDPQVIVDCFNPDNA